MNFSSFTMGCIFQQTHVLHYIIESEEKLRFIACTSKEKHKHLNKFYIILISQKLIKDITEELK
jgi:hypothetical protein